MNRMCQHCQRKLISRPRGLCTVCYYTPSVRVLYPSVSRYGRRPSEDFYGRTVLPPSPTDARPGSFEKLAVLEERARLQQTLWHPDDAGLVDPCHYAKGAA